MHPMVEREYTVSFSGSASNAEAGLLDKEEPKVCAHGASILQPQRGGQVHLLVHVGHRHMKPVAVAFLLHRELQLQAIHPRSAFEACEVERPKGAAREGR